jgi:hypothetical protein
MCIAAKHISCYRPGEKLIATRESVIIAAANNFALRPAFTIEYYQQFTSSDILETRKESRKLRPYQ